VVALVAGVFALAPEVASAATGTFSVTTAFDGTGFDASGNATTTSCPITGTGGDNSPHDGVVCTNDQFAYSWNFSIPSSPTAVVATLDQTLPPGASWNASDVTLCQGGGATGYSGTATLTNGNRTLTCTITWPAGTSRAGALAVVADVSPQLANGTIVAPPLNITQNSVTTSATSPAVTVRALPQVDLRKTLSAPTTNANGDLLILVQVQATSAFAGFPATNVKGIPQLASPISFTDDVSSMPANTTLGTPGNCNVSGPQTATPGTWSCSQPGGPGQPIVISVSGAVTDGLSGAGGGGAGPLMFGGNFYVRVPKANIPSVPTLVTDQLKAFDPSDVGGQSNFGSGFEPGGAPGATCTSNNNCASQTVGGGGGGGGRGMIKAITQITGPALPTNAAGDELMGTGQAFNVRLDDLNQGGVPNTVTCDFFDPAEQQIDATFTPASLYFANPTPVASVVQYTNRSFADDAARAGASCGAAGDNTTAGPWFGSVALAGGPSAVTGYRIVYPSPLPNLILTSNAHFIAKATIQGQVVRDHSREIEPGQAAQLTAAAHFVLSSLISLSKAAFDNAGNPISSALGGQDVRFDLTPHVTPVGQPAATMTIADLLGSCELSPTLTTTATWTMAIIQGPDPGPDGLLCTADDVHGAVVQFTSNAPVTPGSEPVLSYHVVIAGNAPDGRVEVNTATADEPGNAQDVAQRTASQQLTLRAASQVTMSKVADSAQVEIGAPVNFTLQWGNTSSTSVGKTQWIDVVPFNGDGRGTSMHGALKLSTVTVQGTPTNDVTLEYTAAPSASISDNPTDPSNAGGGATTWCAAASFGQPGCPATIAAATAVRITLGNFSSGRVGGVHISEVPTGNVRNDKYVNVVGGGVAASLAQPIPATRPATVSVVASSLGDLVWWDRNSNGVQDAGEPGAAGVTVQLSSGASVIATTTTDSTGHYSFGQLTAGTYTVTVPPASLPSGAVATYDLAGGVSSPAGTSGPINLGVGVDETDVDFGFMVDEHISTQASVSVATSGVVVSDDVTFKGGLSGPYDPQLLGPVAPINGSCAGVNWSSAPALTLPRLTVPSDGTQTTQGTALIAAGCYSYVGTFTAAAIGTVTSSPGVPSETVLVDPVQSSLTTSVSAGLAHPGDSVSDAVTVTMGSGTTTLDWSVVGPVAPVNGSCAAAAWAAAPIFASGVLNSVSNGPTATPATALFDAGCYSYTEGLHASSTSSAASSPAGATNETVLVTALPAAISTSVSKSSGAPGLSVFDNVALGGLFGTSGTASWQLLGPVPSANGTDCAGVNWSGAPVVDIGTFAFTGNANYVTSSTTLNTAGCYTYTDSVPATTRSGAVSTAPGAVNETVFVATNVPTMSTQTQPAGPLSPGDTVGDQVTVSGLGPVKTTLSWALLGPVTPITGNCAGLSWAGAPVLQTGQVLNVGDGVTNTPAVQVPGVGCYSFTDTLQASTSSKQVTSAAGQPTETVQVVPFTPVVTTTASTASAKVGDPVSDSVVLSNLHGASLTMTWTLLGPVAPVNGSCAAVNWGGAPTAASSTVAVSGDGTYPTPAFRFGAAGCFSYVESLPATTTTAARFTAAGAASETTLVVLNPGSVSTRASTAIARSGDLVTDDVTVTMGPGTTDLDWSLVGPVAPVNNGCAAVSWVGAPSAGGGTITVSNGTVTTPSTTVFDRGCYSFVETLHASASTSAAPSPAGAASEVFELIPLPAVIDTLIAIPSGSPGLSESDSVDVSRLNGAKAVVSWQLFGPVSSVNGTDCRGVSWGGAPLADSGAISFTGDGVKPTGSTTLRAAGCYSYADVVPTTSRSGSAVVAAGDPAETVFIAANVPTMTTTATSSGPAPIRPGAQLHDHLVVSGLSGAATSVSWALLGPVSPINGSCAGVSWAAAAPLATGSVAINGDGQYDTPATPIAVVGCYTYTDLLNATSSSIAVTTPPGVASETVLVDPIQSAVSTAVSAGSAHSGDSVDDVVTVTMGAGTTTLDWTVVGPVAPVAGSCTGVSWAGAPTVSSGTQTVSNGQSTTPQATLFDQGCYSYVETLHASSTSSAASSPAGAPGETVLVTTLPAQISTSASKLSGAPGITVSDSVQLGGLFGASGTASWSLLGPVPSPNGSDCTGVVWAGAPVADSGTLPFNGAATYTTSSTRLAVAGCYSYIETVPATSRSSAVTTQPGVAGETIFVATNIPTMTTTAAPSGTASPGDPVIDHVAVSGLGVVTTSLSWQFLGPVAAINGSCAGVTWSSAPVRGSGVISNVGDGTTDTPATPTTTVGCYSFAETLQSSASSKQVTSPAGQLSETVQVIAFTPGVDTTTSATSARVGNAVFDTVALTNMHGAAATMSWSLLGPVAPANGSCAGLNWNGAPTAASGTVPVSGDGSYPTPAKVLTAAGCFTYVESLPATPTTAAVGTLPGLSAETTLVSLNSGALLTVATPPALHSGDTASDIVDVTMGPGSTQLTWSIVGPVAPVNGACAAANWFGAPTVAGGALTVSNGPTARPTAQLFDAGCYSFVEDLQPSASTSAASSPAGTRGETVLVTTQPARITTSAAALSGKPGLTETDSVQLAGLFGASGSVAWRLLGPVASVTGTDCAGVSWTGAPVAASGTVAFSGDGTYSTTPATLRASGCFSYTDDVPATTRSGQASVAAGDPRETVFVATNVPTMTTAVTPSTAVHPGDSLHDHVTVSGLGIAATSVDWSLLGPVAPVGGSCTGVDWTGAPVVGSGTTAVPADGSYDTTTLPVAAVGCFTYTDDLTGTAASGAVASPAGVLAETVLVTPLDPGVSTVVPDTSIQAGHLTHDSVTVTNLRGAAPRATWNLLGPVAAINHQCAGVHWAGARVRSTGALTVNGDGTYRTAPVKLDVGGCYTYIESFDATATTSAITTAAGVASETVYVASAPPLAHTGPPGAHGLGDPLAWTGAAVARWFGWAVGAILAGIVITLIGIRRRRREE
jgi:hypothetical protein